MKTSRLLLLSLVALSVALMSCGSEDTPSAPGALSTAAKVTTTTNECTNTFLGDLSSVLAQWESGLEEQRGSDFLATPPAFSGDVDAFLTTVSPLLGGWKDSLETWRGTGFLDTPPVFSDDVNAYLTALTPLLASWEDSLETWIGSDFLQTPPVFVADTTAPEITCLADTTVDCSGPDGLEVSFDVAVSDSCDSAPLLVCTPASGSVFPVGTTTVTCTATDADGNSSECSFNVTVVADTTPPVITCPVDVTLECTGDGHATYAFTVTATDDCDPEPAVVSDPPSGTSFPLGTTTVTSTATDYAGNSASCTFDVTVVDTTPPVIEDVSVEPTVIWPPNHTMADIAVEVTATDICDPDPTSWIDEVQSNEPANDIGDGNTEPDYEITGPLQVRLRMERQGGGIGRTYTLVIKSSDASGNVATATAEVKVPHDARPE
jgi:hypothetical protein